MTPKRNHDSVFKRQIIGSSEDVISYRTSRCCIGVISRPRAPMDPPAKKMKTSPPTLCDMPDEMLAHIASHLEPGDVFNMVLSSKKLFRPAGVVDLTADEDANREEALGFKLVKWSMRHRLKKILTLFQLTKKKFTFDDLFPEEERNLDFVSGQPQVSFSLLSHQPPAQLCIVYSQEVWLRRCSSPAPWQSSARFREDQGSGALATSTSSAPGTPRPWSAAGFSNAAV